MQGQLKILRRKSARDKLYDVLVFFPDEKIKDMEKGLVLSFDRITMYRLAEAEGVTLEQYIEEDF